MLFLALLGTFYYIHSVLVAHCLLGDLERVRRRSQLTSKASFSHGVGGSTRLLARSSVMTSKYIQHFFLGKELTDDEFRDIPHYRLELHDHVLMKNLQVASSDILSRTRSGVLITPFRQEASSAWASSDHSSASSGADRLERP